MEKTDGKKELLENNINEKQEVSLPGCSFSWKKLIEMKDNNVEFFAGDGWKRLRIFDIDGKTKSLYMVSELGKITWPLRFEKLERIHKIIHAGKATLLPYEIDKLIPIDLVDRKVNKLWRYQMESLTRWVEELRDPS